VKERLVDPGDTTTLSHPVPPRNNALLARTMGSERRLLARGRFPFGHSIVALAGIA
jgi:hypothetical protein